MSSLASQVSPALDLCCYMNATRQIQVARIVNIANWSFERVVFPGQRLLFEAPQNALLEIYATDVLVNTILCELVKVRTAAAIVS